MYMTTNNHSYQACTSVTASVFLSCANSVEFFVHEAPILCLVLNRIVSLIRHTQLTQVSLTPMSCEKHLKGF